MGRICRQLIADGLQSQTEAARTVSESSAAKPADTEASADTDGRPHPHSEHTDSGLPEATPRTADPAAAQATPEESGKQA